MNAKTILLTLIFLSTAPFLYLLTRTDLVSFNLALGNTIGLIGTVLLFWQVILGSRFLAAGFSRDLVWFNKLHQKVGKYGVSVLFLHPILQAIHYGSSIWYMFQIDFSNSFEMYISFGRIAFILLVVIWVASALLRKKLKYRPWLYIHYLAYPMLFFSLYHARGVGTFLSLFPLLGHMWTFMLGTFVLFVIYRLSKFYGFGKAQYELIHKEKVGENIYLFKFKPLSGKVIPKVGQFCYIQASHFGENHPFTVMEADTKTGDLTFGIKVFGPFTEKLKDLSGGHKIWIDGPYGVFTIEGHNDQPKVLIAGGIGITPFVDLVRKYGDESTYLFYANTFINNAVRRELFKEKLDDRYFDALSDDLQEGKNIINGKLEESDLKKFLPASVIKNAGFFICGSLGFYNNYRNILLSMGVVPEKIYYEEFTL